MNDEENATFYMKTACDLARAAKGTTFPNPAVGAVIVRNGTVIAKAATSRSGRPHAEINALQCAGRRARGATMYVSLEPCCHTGRSGPCTDALIRAGIGRVYVARKDSNPLVNGRGIRCLRRHGIDVHVGLCSKEAEEINEDFFFSVVHRRAWVTLKLALTLDGRIADACGNSKWITSAPARRFVHELRRRHAGIGVGATTLKRDNPRLTIRHGKTTSPARFVFTGTPLRHNSSRHFFAADRARRIIVVSRDTRQQKTILKNGVEQWETGTTDRKESLERFLSMAYEENIPSILIEGGASLGSGLLESGLVNRLTLLYGPILLGDGLSCMHFRGGRSIDRGVKLKKHSSRQIGNDFMITGIPCL